MPNIARIWKELESREVTRAFLSRIGNRPESYNYSVLHAKQDINRANNRYSNVLAYDRTAVFVGPSNKYLNASVIPDDGKWWVAAQAPLPNDFGTFFRAIYTHAAGENALVKDMPKLDRKHAILVQLTGWEEGGKVKAHDYMPVGGVVSHKDNDGDEISLRLVEQTHRKDLGSVYSTLELGDDPMTLHHYYFGKWPDHGVPEGDQVTALIALVDQVRTEWEAKKCEVWVHCSAGVGRTGTFLTLLSLALDGTQRQPPQSPLGPLPIDEVIAQRVDSMREYRCALVQTLDQLDLIYNIRGAA